MHEEQARALKNPCDDLSYSHKRILVFWRLFTKGRLALFKVCKVLQVRYFSLLLPALNKNIMQLKGIMCMEGRS
jgi:hypothetical protein